LNETGFSVRNVATQTHGRVLTKDAADSLSPNILVVFHGYAQSAEIALMDVSSIPGVVERWRVVAIQALHRFYAKDERVVASWMTRQDREEAIADNVAYVDRVVAEEIARRGQDDHRIVFLGFSQGASMAYRAAVLGRHQAAGVIAFAGDIPPEVKQPAAMRQRWPRVLIGVGDQEHWYTPDKVSADSAFLVTQGVTPDISRFNGGHEWTNEFRTAVGKWLGALA
jgi:predicted esterase